MNKPNIKGCINRAIQALDKWSYYATPPEEIERLQADLKAFRDALPKFYDAYETTKLTLEAVNDE